MWMDNGIGTLWAMAKKHAQKLVAIGGWGGGWGNKLFYLTIPLQHNMLMSKLLLTFLPYHIHSFAR